MRGDDSHIGIDGNGHMSADHVSLIDYVDQAEDQMLDWGRVMPVGVAESNLYYVLVPERFPNKLGIVLLSLACIAALMLLLRTLGVASRNVFLAVAVAFALSLQFRATHDPMLGYSGTGQLTVLELLLGLTAYVRYLQTGSRRWYAASIVAVLLLVFTYEANPPLVLAFAALYLGRPFRLSRMKPLIPILGLGAAVTLLSVYMHSHASTVVEGYQTSLDPILVAQVAVRQAVSGIPDIYFVSGSLGLLPDPTRAELFGAFWRGLIAAALFLFVLLALRRARPTTAQFLADPGYQAADDRRAVTLQVAGIGTVMMACSGLYISLAKQHQELIFLGNGHLATFTNTIGFVLLFVALGLAWGRTIARHLVLVGSLGFLVFWMVFASSYSNFRVVAIEQPGIQQRTLMEQALDRGVLNGVRPGTTMYLLNRDMNWSFGNLVFYGGTSDYLVYLRTGLKLDVRTLAPPAPACGPPVGFPVSDCATPSRRVALLAVRASRGGGTVVLARGIPADHVTDTGAQGLTVVAREASAAGEQPRITGAHADGSPWSAADATWTRRPLGDGWVRYTTSITDGSGPVATSITDPYAVVDFDTPAAPGTLAREFGTKELLP
ncbi:MAG TPA: hypothetical protein VFU10_11560 [Gaiellaceae bacterium]|nr:hypothetical protein [Gaiellaceae bacterium]